MTYSYPQIKDAGVVDLHRDFLRVFYSRITQKEVAPIPMYIDINKDFLSGLDYLITEYIYYSPANS